MIRSTTSSNVFKVESIYFDAYFEFELLRILLFSEALWHNAVVIFQWCKIGTKVKLQFGTLDSALWRLCLTVQAWSKVSFVCLFLRFNFNFNGLLFQSMIIQLRNKQRWLSYFITDSKVIMLSLMFAINELILVTCCINLAKEVI